MLATDNPRASSEQVSMYASAFVQFWEAEENIRRNGHVCANPRTGAPMDNPYLRVRAAAEKSIQGMSRARLKSDRLWIAAERELRAKTNQEPESR
jgi:phage terminase small subunit